MKMKIPQKNKKYIQGNEKRIMTRKEDEENIQIIEEKKPKVYNIYKKERSNDIECLQIKSVCKGFYTFS